MAEGFGGLELLVGRSTSKPLYPSEQNRGVNHE
jgi:hypothetical protein